MFQLILMYLLFIVLHVCKRSQTWSERQAVGFGESWVVQYGHKKRMRCGNFMSTGTQRPSLRSNVMPHMCLEDQL